jgi:hypothetical protein
LEVEDPLFLWKDDKRVVLEIGSLEDLITNYDYDCAI